jgi:hypothetical protein
MTSTDMSGDVRAGLAQWTPDSDPGVNLRTAEAALGGLGRTSKAAFTAPATCYRLASDRRSGRTLR